MDDRFAQIKDMDEGDLAERLLGPVEKYTGGRAYWHCPMHEDHRPSLFLNTEGNYQGRFACFPCGFHGDIIDLYVWIKNMSKREVLDLLAPREIVPPPATGTSSQTPGDYIASRRWDSEITEALGLELVWDKYGCPRLRFPFRMGGEVVYWQDRALGNSSIRWLSHEGSAPCPYEVDRIAQGNGSLFVCEGLSDVVSLLCAFPDAAVVGIPGSTAMKPDWAGFFAGVDLVLIGDNDEAGMKFRATMQEYGGFNHNLYIPDEFKDLSDWRIDDVGSFPHQFEQAVAGLHAGTAGPSA